MDKRPKPQRSTEAVIAEAQRLSAEMAVMAARLDAFADDLLTKVVDLRDVSGTNRRITDAD
jgi:hypothetical protein